MSDAGEAFLGRADELAALEVERALAQQGSPRVVLVQGEPGIGKTALVRRFLERVEDRVLRATGDVAERDVPFALIDQLLRPVRKELPAAFIDVFRGVVSDPFTVGGALVDVIGALQDDGPLILAVDDAHWVDLPSLQALTFALRRLMADRVLTVLVSRTADLSAVPQGLIRLAEATGRTLELSGLSATDIASIAETLGVEIPNRSDANMLHRHTSGNPLYATALLKEGVIPGEAGSRDAPLPVPASYDDVVGVRLGAAAADERSLSAAAAVLGPDATLAEVTALAGVEATRSALDHLVGRGLLTVRGEGASTRIGFPHPLTHAALYHRIPRAHRRELHRDAAARSGNEQARLRHLALAADGPDEQLAEELTAFAQKEAVRGSWTSAAWALLTAAELSDSRTARQDLTLRAIEHSIAAGDTATVTRFASSLAEFDNTPRLHCVQGMLSLFQGDQAKAEQLFRRALVTLGDPPSDPDLWRTIWGWLAPLLQNAGRSDEALEWGRVVIDAYTRNGTPAVNGSMALSVLHLSGEADQAIDAITDQLAADDLDPLQTDLLVGTGIVGVWSEDLQRARTALDRAARLARRNGPFISLIVALFYLADAEFRLGLWDDAITHGQLAVTTAEDADQVWVYALVHGAAAWPLAGRGMWEAAEHHARAAQEAAAALGDLGARLWAATADARLAHARGNAAGVVQALEPLLTSPHAIGLWFPGVQAWEGLYLEALTSLGRLDDAERMLTSFEARINPDGPASARADAARVRGMLAGARSDYDKATESLHASLRWAEASDRPFLLARNRLQIGRFLRQHGSRRAAIDQLTAAADCFDRLGAQPYGERCRHELAAAGHQQRDRHDAAGRPILTPQETAVATLVERGMSNREIAGELFVSAKTVEYHLGNIYTKLGVRSRTALAHLVREGSSPEAVRREQ